MSLNQTAIINPLKILARYTYAHPQYSLNALAAQARWEELHGVHHSYFCGAYWANGFHEDGVVSALRVAQAAPWPNASAANDDIMDTRAGVSR